MIDDRKLERHAEQSKHIETKQRQKAESSFRAEFMQKVANELTSMGAPVSMHWEQLLKNNDSCHQAFRLILTRMKSSQRVREHHTPRPTSRKSRDIQKAKDFLEERPAWNSGDNSASGADEATTIEQDQSFGSERYGGAGISVFELEEDADAPIERPVRRNGSEGSKKLKHENEVIKLE